MSSPTPINSLTPFSLLLTAGCDHVNPANCTTCNLAIETLIDAFTNSVSEYLTGETTENFSQNASKETTSQQQQQLSQQLPQRRGLERAGLKGFSKSQDNLSAKFTSYIDVTQPFSEPSE